MRGRRTASHRGRIRALNRAGRDLQIVFQPICELGSGDTVGHEALARFPQGRPDYWFNEAHALGQGLQLEMTAVTQAVSLADTSSGYVSLNVSPLAVAAPAFVEFILGLPDPRRLVLELTEHTAVGDYESLCGALQRLRDAGVRVAVDDAGGGISSFRHILMISPEIIKLDRSLIADLDVHRGRQALADLMVQFAARMGAQLVAEGIERPEEHAACSRHGITYGQGYLFGRPNPSPRHRPEPLGR